MLECDRQHPVVGTAPALNVAEVCDPGRGLQPSLRPSMEVLPVRDLDLQRAVGRLAAALSSAQPTRPID